MKSDNIILFPGAVQATAAPQVQGFDLVAYERRAAARFRRASICAWLTTAVEAVVTLAIGGCILLSTLAVWAML